jgi:DNA-directed RNA polymerase subunit RPC12/RpoP
MGGKIMGMFDSVYLECPGCGHKQEVQSKAGPCEMMIYTKDNAPAEVLLDVSREIVTCEECGEKYKIVFEYRTKVVHSGDESSRWKNPVP